MQENQLPFIPAWLDDAGLSPVVFRLYCHLRRRADNSTGIAWPPYEEMTRACGVSRNTIYLSLKELERRGLIAKVGKPFGLSCRYRVLAPIVSPEIRMEHSNSITRDTNEAAPIVSPENCNRISSNTPIVSPQIREGKPKKVNQKKVNQRREISLEGNQFASWFKSSLPPEINLQANWHQKFAEAYDDLVRLDKRPDQDIRDVCLWARNDPFWQSNFYSPAKLRTRNKDGISYFDVFRERMKSATRQPTRPPVDTGHRKASIEYV
jgi:transposase